MKKSIRFSFVLFVALTVLLSGCAPASTPVPTTVPSTFTQSPISPTITPEPTATNIPEPTVTPIVLPDTLNSTFSGISIVYRDSFDFVVQNVLPVGWECDEKYAGWVTEENNFKIKPADSGDWSGTVAYFSQERITPGMGVYFTFQYTGKQENFTLGFDVVQKNGERIKYGEGGFHSVAMQEGDGATTAHIVREGWQDSNFFDGNLKLQENTWYDIALGYDNNNNYIIEIWQPETPLQKITYIKKWDDFPREYYFISWVSSKRSVQIDDFTIFRFEEIVPK